jgi:RNA recognition motif-containing protein
VRNTERRDTQPSPLPSPSAAEPHPIVRNLSRQSLAELTLADAPAPTPPPRDVSSSAFSAAESKTVTELLSYLGSNPYAYDQHVQLVGLLHKGFLAHVYSSDTAASATHAKDYSLLVELRQAREALDTRFAVGEDIWSDWLSDEVLLATSTEERMTVTELFQRAVQDEPMSVKLWLAYSEWIAVNHAACYDSSGSIAPGWTAESISECQELFTKDTLRSVLEQAVTATRWRIDESHLLWSRLVPLVLDELPQTPSSDDVERLRTFFLQRMQIPHAEPHLIEQAFWSAISRFQGAEWETVMEHAKHHAESSKEEFNRRKDGEFSLQRATQESDSQAIRKAFEKYLLAEKFRKPRGNFYYELRCALYERALLRFPVEAAWWLDYIDFAMSAPESENISLLPLIERATRHCPGSGDLWSRRILRADVERKSRNEVEAIKHRATNSGLLDLGGMEEMVKMLQQWCSYLRRHAFSRINLEDDVDTAEFGIMSALDDIHQAGKMIYGPDFPGDPLFRLEQVQIKFYTESRRTDEARKIYESLAQQQLYARSYDFWNKYYNWELWLWGFDRLVEKHRVETIENGPHRATKVVQKALAQKTLDLPGSVLELYLYHFQQHESAEKLQAALVDSRNFTLRLAKQAAKEAAEAAELQAQYAAAAVVDPVSAQVKEEPVKGEKRKREEETLTDDNESAKKPKVDGDDKVEGDHGKRDREHNTVSLKNLPIGTTEEDIKDFFQDFGTILAINVLPIIGANDKSTTATVEFESHADATSSIIRSGKQLKGNEITVHSGGQNVLYVCNYPPEYSEDDIRGLFKHYGEVASVRFPSLNLNSRRRFCYVSFLTAEMAKSAEAAVDGKKLDGVHTLIAKISDPNAKKHRSGPQEEGREIFVKNIDRNGTEEEINLFFAEYGKIESSHLLRHVNKQLTGTGFFVYETAGEANAAVEGANQKPFRDRVLTVQLSTPKGKIAPLDRMKKQDILIKQPGATPEPADRNGDTHDRRDSDISMSTSTAPQQADSESHKTIRERKIAIFNLPDTVNDARVRSVMEHYGPLTKIQMRRDIQGAIVEFTNLKDAFNVRQGVDVSSLGTGVVTGDVGDLLAIKKNKKAAAVGGGSGGGSALSMMPTSIAKGLGGGRGRGGLGTKRGGGRTPYSAARSEETPAASKTPAATVDGEAKSNADFRRMFAASATESKGE